jgi:lipopolysaccharide biosynthesis regulator YciM
MDWTIPVLIAALVVAFLILFYVKFFQHSRIAEHDMPYTQGLSYMVDGDLDKAKEKFNEAVRLDSDNVEAYIKLGALMRETGQVVQAVKVHQSLTVRPTLKPPQKLEIFKQLAQDYHRAESYKKAAVYADKILTEDKDNRWALTLRIELAERLRDWNTAFNLTKKLNALQGVKSEEKLALYRVEEGQTLIAEGKGRDGRVKCREALRLDRACAPAYVTLAKSYVKEERQEDALKEIKNLLEANPGKGYLAYNLMEDLYFNLGRFDEIEALYREILSKRPDDLPAAKALARFLRKKGEVDRTMAVCQEALTHHPDDLWMRRYMIRTLLSDNRVDDIGPIAIELLDRIFEEEPHFTCSNCGFKSNEALLRCPDCSKLGTFDL